MSNRMLALMMGVVAFLILAVGLVFVLALAAGGGDDDDGTPSSGDDDDRSPVAGTGICSGDSLMPVDVLSVNIERGWPACTRASCWCMRSSFASANDIAVPSGQVASYSA